MWFFLSFIKSHLNVNFKIFDILLSFRPKFGYVKKLSMLSPTRDNKARYFTFTVQLENVSLRKSINWYQKYSPKNRAVKYKNVYECGK